MEGAESVEPAKLFGGLVTQNLLMRDPGLACTLRVQGY